MYVTQIDTLSASDRAYQARVALLYVLPVSEELQGISLVNRLPIEFPSRRLLGQWTFLRDISALAWAVVYNKQLEFIFPNLIFFSY